MTQKNIETFLIINILEDGTVVYLSSHNLTKKQRSVLESIKVCTDSPSLILRCTLFIEKILVRLTEKFTKNNQH